MIHQGNRVCTTWWYITHVHRVFDMLHMFRVPFYGIIKYDNVFLIPVLHEVWSVYHKIYIQ